MSAEQFRPESPLENIDPSGLETRMLDVLAQHNLSLIGQPLPCGQQECRPFEEGCIQPENDRNPAPLARIACQQAMAIDLLSQRITEREDLLDRVSVDSITGVLTYNAQVVLLERMFESGQIEEMEAAGFTLECLIADLDKLNQHNALGGHDGGNAALRAYAQALGPFYKRSTDTVMIRSEQFEQSRLSKGILAHEETARLAIKQGSSFPQLGRFETGDEVIGFSWVEPRRGRRDPLRPGEALDAVHSRVESIINGTRDLYVEYPYASKFSPDELRAQFGDQCLNFTVDMEAGETGIVRASVSAAFAIGVGPLPTSMENFREIFSQIDNETVALKKHSDRTKSRGVAKSLFIVS